jgi:polyhydroxyalkanoate synthesis repressor PhaR
MGHTERFMAQRDDQPRRLTIKRYSNRRFYDTSQSRHLTLGDMYELIRQGSEISITDSRTGEDITNLVLTQIILDRDPPKLEILPANILHELIRTQQQLLGSVVEQYFRQVVDAQRASQERWTAFLKNTLGLTSLPSMNPLEWARMFMPNGERAGGSEPAGSPGGGDARDFELRELRRQIEELREQIRSEPGARKKKSR